MDPRAFARQKPPHANLMFVRDLFVNTRAGAVAARMASEVRAGEELYAAHALAGLALPIARSISGRGVLEGADALWLDRRNMLCGVGARTNPEGYRQLAQQLALQGVRSHAVKLPRQVQHLLGILQLVDRDLALVRTELAPAALLTRLKRAGIRVVSVPELAEVTEGQGMNIVTVRPRTIVMPEGCPRLESLYRASGLRIAGRIAIPELLKGAGGIACATGILAREVAR
jgi:N-dimethylarginine dimethylaminohydrolase